MMELREQSPDASTLFSPSMFSSLMGHSYANEALTSKLLIGGSLIIAANLTVIQAMKRRDS